MLSYERVVITLAGVIIIATVGGCGRGGGVVTWDSAWQAAGELEGDVHPPLIGKERVVLAYLQHRFDLAYTYFDPVAYYWIWRIRIEMESEEPFGYGGPSSAQSTRMRFFREPTSGQIYIAVDDVYYHPRWPVERLRGFVIGRETITFRDFTETEREKIGPFEETWVPRRRR